MQKFTTLLLCAALLALTGCGEQSDSAQNSNDTGENSVERINIFGELTYRQRIALPPDASATVTLLDLGQGDANVEETIVTQIHLSDFKQVPIAFSLTYPSDVIHSGNTYRLRARIRDKQGKLLWRSHGPIKFDPLDDSKKLTIVMQQASSGSQEQTLSYNCDGKTFSVTVTPDTATLQSSNHIVELPAVRSASGAKYSDGDNVFWSKGQEQALVIIDGTTYKNCRRKD